MGPESVGRLFIVETAVVTASKPFKQLGFLSRSVEPSPLTGALCYRQTRAGSPHAGNGASTADVIAFGRGQTPAAAQTWRDLERYRRFFPRALVVKGILNPADAVRAAEIGVDGIIVPNHSGRQLDQPPTGRKTAEAALPRISCRRIAPSASPRRRRAGRARCPSPRRCGPWFRDRMPRSRSPRECTRMRNRRRPGRA